MCGVFVEVYSTLGLVQHEHPDMKFVVCADSTRSHKREEPHSG